MRRVADLDVKNEAWRCLVVAAIARSTVKGLPKPAGLPANGDEALQWAFGRSRVLYRMPGRTVTLGSVKDSYREHVRQQWLRRNPITLECGRRVVVTFDGGNPDLARPIPVEAIRRRLTLQGA